MKFTVMMVFTIACACGLSSQAATAETLEEFMTEFRQFPLGITTNELLARFPDAKQEGPVYLHRVSCPPFDREVFQFQNGVLIALLADPDTAEPSETAAWIIKWADPVVEAMKRALGKSDSESVGPYVDSLEIAHLIWSDKKSRLVVSYTTPASLRKLGKATSPNIHFIISKVPNQENENEVVQEATGVDSTRPQSETFTAIKGAPVTTNNPSSSGSWEHGEAKVLKAYVASDGGAEFRAYVVMWKGHEVVVGDPLAGSTYKEGDTIRFLAMRLHSPKGAGAYDLLNFHIMPEPHAKKIVSLAGLYSGSAGVASPKSPSYVDCHPDGVILYPGGLKVSWDELQKPKNPVEQLLDQVQEHKESEYVSVLVRPQSVKYYRTVRNLIGRHSIDATFDVVDADTKVDWDESRKALAVANEAREATSVEPSQSPSFKPTPQADPSNQRPVFFECRGNKVFFIDKDGLDAQVAKLEPILKGDRSQFLKAIQGQEIGNENYKMNLTYLQVGIMALEPRADASGENREQVGKPDSKFQTALSQLDPKTQYVAFLVRDDSFSAYRLARSIAAQRGFNTGLELMGADEPIKFGASVYCPP